MGKQADREQAEKAEEQAIMIARGKALMEARMGPVQRHGVHNHSGCPKCGTPGDLLTKRHHHGYSDLAPNDMCWLELEHLHGICKPCGFEWREQVKDADADIRRVPCEPVGATEGFDDVLNPIAGSGANLAVMSVVDE